MEHAAKTINFANDDYNTGNARIGITMLKMKLGICVGWKAKIKE